MNRRTARVAFAAAALCLMASAAPAQEKQEEPDQPSVWSRDENIGLGLFGSVSMSPIPSFRTGMGPRLPSTLQAGEVDLRINEDWARVLSVKNEWLLDYDVLRSNLGLSIGLMDRLRLDLDYETGTRTTGYLDTFIIGFHRTFNLSIGNRRQYANHPQRIEIHPRDGSTPVVLDEHDQQPYQQSLIVGTQYTLLEGDDYIPFLAASLSLRRLLAPGDLSVGSPIDVGGSLSMAKALGPLNLYLGASVAWFGNEELSGLPLRPLMWSGILGLELRCFDWMSITGQYLITSGGVDSLGDLSRPSHEITAGFKWDLGGGALLEFAILENVVNFFNSPDFGVHLGFAVRF
jgi:hypothetical protein